MPRFNSFVVLCLLAGCAASFAASTKQGHRRLVDQSKAAEAARDVIERLQSLEKAGAGGDLKNVRRSALGDEGSVVPESSDGDFGAGIPTSSPTIALSPPPAITVAQPPPAVVVTASPPPAVALPDFSSNGRLEVPFRFVFQADCVNAVGSLSARNSFMAALRQSLATGLGVSVSQVNVTQVVCGSVIASTVVSVPNSQTNAQVTAMVTSVTSNPSGVLTPSFLTSYGISGTTVTTTVDLNNLPPDSTSNQQGGTLSASSSLAAASHLTTGLAALAAVALLRFML